MKMPWFRLYSEWLNDAKVQMMSEVMQRRHVALLCMRAIGDVPTSDDQVVAFMLRLSPEDTAATKAEFIRRGLITEDWDIPKWEERQHRSDHSHERVARHREVVTDENRYCNGKKPLLSRKKPVLEQNRTEQIQNREEEKRVVDETSTSPADAGPSPSLRDPEKHQSRNHVPCELIVQAWNDEARSLPHVAAITDKRRAKIRSRWFGVPGADSLEFWRDLFQLIQETPFLLGDNERNWRVSLDWVMQSNDHVAKIIEGSYTRGKPSRASPVRPVTSPLYVSTFEDEK